MNIMQLNKKEHINDMIQDQFNCIKYNENNTHQIIKDIYSYLNQFELNTMDLNKDLSETQLKYKKDNIHINNLL